MMTSRVRLLMASAFCASLTSCLGVIAHDQQAAARAATEFARVAFVARDAPKAYSLAAPGLAKQTPAGEFAGAIARMHPKSYPTRVSATDYEPMPGQRGMMIYMRGDGDGEEFYYRLVMEGDAGAGYRVTGLFRGNGPHPSTNKRPL